MIDWSDARLKEAVRLIGRVPVEALLKLEHKEVGELTQNVVGIVWDAYRMVYEYIYESSVEKYVEDMVKHFKLEGESVIVAESDGITIIPFITIKPSEITNKIVADWRKQRPRKMLTCYIVGAKFDLPEVIETVSRDLYYAENEDEIRMRDGEDEEWLASKEECERTINYYFDSGNYGDVFFLVRKKDGTKTKYRDPDLDYDEGSFD